MKFHDSTKQHKIVYHPGGTVRGIDILEIASSIPNRGGVEIAWWYDEGFDWDWKRIALVEITATQEQHRLIMRSLSQGLRSAKR